MSIRLGKEQRVVHSGRAHCASFGCLLASGIGCAVRHAALPKLHTILHKGLTLQPALIDAQRTVPVTFRVLARARMWLRRSRGSRRVDLAQGNGKRLLFLYIECPCDHTCFQSRSGSDGMPPQDQRVLHTFVIAQMVERFDRTRQGATREEQCTCTLHLPGRRLVKISMPRPNTFHLSVHIDGT